MDFSTEQFKASVEQISTVMSDLVTAYVQEGGGMGGADPKKLGLRHIMWFHA